MALDKRAWRCQKGHGAHEKGHGAAPCYFALDLTLLGLSDHNLIFCTRKISRGQINKYNTVKTRSMKNYNVEVFKNELSNIDWDLCLDAGHIVDENWNIFRDLYMKVVDKLALVKEIRLKQRTEPWMSKEILDLTKERGPGVTWWNTIFKLA